MTRLDTIRREHGERSVAGLNQERIETMLSAYDDRPASKLDTLKKRRILIKHAMKKKWIGADPSAGIKRTKIGEIRAWTDDEIRQFENRWPIGTKQRTAFALMLYTGQRRSDVHQMTWRDIDPRIGRIKVTQQKTGVKIEVPLHRDLLTVLERVRHNHVSISSPSMENNSRWMASPASCAMPSGPRDCRWIVSRTDYASRWSPLGGSRVQHQANHVGPWSQVACGSGEVHAGCRSNPAGDGGDVAAGSANRERYLPKNGCRFGHGAEKIRRYKVKAKRLALPRGIVPLFQP